MVKVKCTVCGNRIGKLGIGKHSKMHKRQFRESFERPPEDYDEVRSRWPFGDGCRPEEQATIAEYE